MSAETNPFLSKEEKGDNELNSSSIKDNSVSLEVAGVVNPGIETSDPDKLNIKHKEKKHIPSGKRCCLRFFTLLASVGAEFFNLCSPIVAQQLAPTGANTLAIIFLHIVASISILVSIYFVFLYCFRRFGSAKKINRILLHLIDLVFAISFGVLMVFMIGDFKCPIGVICTIPALLSQCSVASCTLFRSFGI
ncbi:714_t:CDS:2 [Dentiscutata erythropus]|uniref:714_t:CDS:1 n=1 Tax=Dentiscutata erythropus TaxID=1348616 RepID=A0A9N9EL29_9GLOM|nr:714_t:CDS:2 [Dentiscutata erythropus]